MAEESETTDIIAQPAKQFEFYLRMATNYGLAIFLVLYYVIVIQPRDASRIDDFRAKLGDIEAALDTAKEETEDLSKMISRLQDDTARGQGDLKREFSLLAERGTLPTTERPGDGSITDTQLRAIRGRVQSGFEEHLLYSLSHNTHSEEYFPNEIRHVVSEEFEKNSPFDLRSAMFSAEPQLVRDFESECTKLTGFLFDQYADEFGLNANGQPIANAAELRKRARDHLVKQSDSLLKRAWAIVGK